LTTLAIVLVVGFGVLATVMFEDFEDIIKSQEFDSGSTNDWIFKIVLESQIS
jgi:hypothetical protein